MTTAQVLTLCPAVDVSDEARTALADLDRVRSQLERGIERTDAEGRELNELLEIASIACLSPRDRVLPR